MNFQTKSWYTICLVSSYCKLKSWSIISHFQICQVNIKNKITIEIQIPLPLHICILRSNQITKKESYYHIIGCKYEMWFYKYLDYANIGMNNKSSNLKLELKPLFWNHWFEFTWILQHFDFEPNQTNPIKIYQIKGYIHIRHNPLNT